MTDSFLKYLERLGLTASTRRHYHTYVLDFLTWLDGQNMEPEAASSRDIAAYLGHLKTPSYNGGRGLSNLTRSIRLNVLQHSFNYQISVGARVDNPARHQKIRGANGQKLYPILSREELAELVDQCDIPQADDPNCRKNWFKLSVLSRKRNKVILGLMIHQGLTTPEVDRLELNDLRLREGLIHIAGSIKGKERLLELKAHQVVELMEYLADTRLELLGYCPTSCQNVFLATPPAGKSEIGSYSTQGIWKRLSQDMKKEFPRFVNFKQVRASVITHWLGEHNLREVQYRAGHRFVSSTERYLVNRMDDLLEDIERFHPLG